MAKRYKRRYKWLADDRPVYGSDACDLGGAWQSVEGPLALCDEQGYHVCSREQVAHWRGTSLWEVEVDGECLRDGTKEDWRKIRFVRQLRWTKRDMVECAARDAAAANDAASRASASAAKASSKEDADYAAEAYAVTNAYANAAEAYAYAANASSYAADAAVAVNARAVASVASAYAALYAAYTADAATNAVAAEAAADEAAYAASYVAERQRQMAWIEGRLGETLR